MRSIVCLVRFCGIGVGMATYVETCKCKGMHPSGVVGLHHNLRSDLVGRLLKDRHAARFLIAPKGYGKSSLAYEYAHIVFGFEHVFWLRCTSPCFLRDLDAGSLFVQMKSADSDARLVVFDDVPSLDPERTRAFAELMDGLLDDGCEVMVACIPSVDTFSHLQLDSTVLTGDDLLLTDDEIQMERIRGNLAVPSAEGVPRSQRAPLLVWGHASAGELLRGMRDEELSGEFELAVFMMLVLQEGALSELRPVLPGKRIEEELAYIGSMYPHLGIDVDEGTFDCLSATVGEVVSAGRVSIATVASASAQHERHDFCMQTACMLLGRGMASRACDFMGCCAEKQTVSTWLHECGWQVLCACAPLGLLTLLDKVPAKSDAGAAALRTLEAWALFMLGERERSVKAVHAAALSKDASWEDVAAAAILLAHLEGTSATGKDAGPSSGSASVALERALSLRGMQLEAGEAEAPHAGNSCPVVPACIDWGTFAELEASRDSEADYMKTWDALVRERSEDGPATQAMLVSAAWLFDDLSKDAVAGEPSRAGDVKTFMETGSIGRVVSFVAATLCGSDGAGAFMWPTGVAALALDGFLGENPYIFNDTVSPSLVGNARKMSISLVEQAASLGKSLEVKAKAKGEFELTHPDAFRKGARTASQNASLRVSTPPLNISLFGGLDVWIGDDAQDVRTPVRKKVKTALAMLALGRGREIAKRRFTEELWPDSDEDSRRRSLYSVWSRLKRDLSVGGSCPYLMRTQAGYKLDFRHVTTDMEDFDDLCKTLLFGSGGRILWEEMYEKVSNEFAEDMLTDITGVGYIDSMRARCRAQMIDGLVAASVRLAREGESSAAAWFAREALRRDNSREDAYIALMEAQIASHQRGAALDTYFECRKYLSEQLGIDPSQKVMELYRSIIETEAKL